MLCGRCVQFADAKRFAGFIKRRQKKPRRMGGVEVERFGSV
jgi:hypothetical protein